MIAMEHLYVSFFKYIYSNIGTYRFVQIFRSNPTPRFMEQIFELSHQVRQVHDTFCWGMLKRNATGDGYG